MSSTSVSSSVEHSDDLSNSTKEVIEKTHKEISDLMNDPEHRVKKIAAGLSNVLQ